MKASLEREFVPLFSKTGLGAGFLRLAVLMCYKLNWAAEPFFFALKMRLTLVGEKI